MQNNTTLSLFQRVKKLDFDSIMELQNQFQSKKMFTTKIGNLKTLEEGNTENLEPHEVIIVSKALNITPHLVCFIGNVQLDKNLLDYFIECHEYKYSKEETHAMLNMK